MGESVTSLGLQGLPILGETSLGPMPNTSSALYVVLIMVSTRHHSPRLATSIQPENSLLEELH